MNHAKRLLDLFYRLHFALRTGAAPGDGWGEYAGTRIARGEMPQPEIYAGRHVKIFSDALNLRVAQKVDDHTGRGLIDLRAGRDLDGKWEVEVSCCALGYVSPDEAAKVAQGLAHAATLGRICEEILAGPLDFDVGQGRCDMEEALRTAWDEVGREKLGDI